MSVFSKILIGYENVCDVWLFKDRQRFSGIKKIISQKWNSSHHLSLKTKYKVSRYCTDNRLICLPFDLAPGPLLSPQESVALLTQAGLFDNAFTVAFHFNLPKETIFEGLASR